MAGIISLPNKARYRPDEVAAELGISSKSVKIMIRHGVLAAENITQNRKPCWRVRQDVLDRFLAERADEHVLFKQ